MDFYIISNFTNFEKQCFQKFPEKPTEGLSMYLRDIIVYYIWAITAQNLFSRFMNEETERYRSIVTFLKSSNPRKYLRIITLTCDCQKEQVDEEVCSIFLSSHTKQPGRSESAVAALSPQRKTSPCHAQPRTFQGTTFYSAGQAQGTLLPPSCTSAQLLPGSHTLTVGIKANVTKSHCPKHAFLKDNY